MKRINKSDKKWITSTLMNDENSSNLELEQYFMKEGKMSLKEASCYVKQREKAMNNWKDFKLKLCKKK